MQQPDHPGVAHYIIHAYDYPPLAEQALDAARRYAKIAPDSPHALHMPSHIFTRLAFGKSPSLPTSLRLPRHRNTMRPGTNCTRRIT